MNLATRLDALERGAGLAGPCPTCGDRPVHRVAWPGESDPPPARCPRCGRDRLVVIRVAWNEHPRGPSEDVP